MSWNDLSTGMRKPDHRADNQLLARPVSTLMSHRGPSPHGSVGFVLQRSAPRGRYIGPPSPSVFVLLPAPSNLVLTIADDPRNVWALTRLSLRQSRATLANYRTYLFSNEPISEACFIPSPNSPAGSLRIANHFPAVQMLLPVYNYLIYLPL